MHRGGLLLAVAAVLFCAIPAAAAIDEFYIGVDETGNVVDGGGTGYGGQWYYYDNTGWWNQWFYNGPPDPTRWKEVDVIIDIFPYGVPNHGPDCGPNNTYPYSYAEIVYNWSTLDWQMPDQPPLPPLMPHEEDMYIGRLLDQPIWAGEVFAPTRICHSMSFKDIIPYNPEWISIDIRGAGFGISWGQIDHRCVPEPATMLILGVSALVLMRKRKSR